MSEAPLQPPAPPPSRAGGEWWLRRGGQDYGPYSLSALIYIRQDNRALDSDQVSQDPAGPWIALGELLARVPPVPTPALESPPPGQAAPATTDGGTPRAMLRPTSCLLGGLLVLALFVAAPLVTVGPLYRQAQVQSFRSAAEDSLKQLGLALELYAYDHGDRLPPAGQWETTVASVLGQSPPLRSPGGGAYEFNPDLAGRRWSQVRSTPRLWLARDLADYHRRCRAHPPGRYVLDAAGQVSLTASPR